MKEINKHIEEFKKFLKASQIIIDAHIIDTHLTEMRGLFKGKASVLLRPHSTKDVSAIVSYCFENDLILIPQGGRTGVCGGAMPDSSGNNILLDLSLMKSVRHIDLVSNVITVEAGTILSDLQDMAKENNRFFPLSLGSEASCQIGGNIATNAGGTAVLRYGNIKDQVLGLEVVLPNGDVWNGLKYLHKDNSGYHLKDLFVGSEGTLGIITAASLKLYPEIKKKMTAFIATDSIEKTISSFLSIRDLFSEHLSSFEWISGDIFSLALKHYPEINNPFSDHYSSYILVEFTSSHPNLDLENTVEEALSRLYEKNMILNSVIAQNEKQAKELWFIREAIVWAQKEEGGSIKNDISVPLDKMTAFITEAYVKIEELCPGARLMPFGHIGDGNLHFNISQPVNSQHNDFYQLRGKLTKVVNDIAVSYQGSFAAEHGVGQLKLSEMKIYKSSIEIDLMKKIKKTLDSKSIMNPNKIID